MDTGRTIDGIRVYGPRPAREAIEARAKRDGFDPACLFPALEAHRRILPNGKEHVYLVEVWAKPDRFAEDTFWTYRTRRDGRIELSWASVRGKNIRRDEVAAG